MKKIIFFLFIFLVACGAPAVAPTVTPLPPTATPSPSVTLTVTPPPTSTLTPTNTPYPSELVDEKGVYMRLVPAGEFTMGSDHGKEDEIPAHLVYLDDFYMDKYEVTNALYKACVEASGCTPLQQAISNTYDNYLVIKVDWKQAQDYCEWRGGSLPTEAQWEKAARGTDGRDYPWGNQFVDGSRVNFCDKNCSAVWTDPRSDDGYASTAPVGSYESGKSPYGIYDLAGNVWEWVADWYSDTYYQNSPASNPLGPDSGQYRVLRGASWVNVNYAGNIRSANRGRLTPDSIDSTVGFHCAKDANP